jgi:hypothetical protein
MDTQCLQNSEHGTCTKTPCMNTTVLLVAVLTPAAEQSVYSCAKILQCMKSAILSLGNN